ncbi:MAG: hypothetical protein JSS81_05240 [Acidobacteria bacterium]|nr:hypothetical protein [Acidobacteriota bacterium]
MKKRNYKHYIRKAHRYLGVVIGVQFFCWTLGGLYFSWTNIKEIRGERLRHHHETVAADRALVAPKTIVEELQRGRSDVEIGSLRLVGILGEPFYEIKYKSAGEEKTLVAAAIDGKIRPLLTEDEARQIGLAALREPQSIRGVEFLTAENVGGHHEYREKPLPAWAVTFETGLTVYLSAETGQIGAFRTNGWRVFDFLWMLHTMDFETRDDINNYLLRGFSALGIVTLLSGFLLFFVSSKFLRRILFLRPGRRAG